MTHEEELALTDEQLQRRHGDHSAYSIKRWRAEFESGETSLNYVDWRCDKLWCAAQRRRDRRR